MTKDDLSFYDRFDLLKVKLDEKGIEFHDADSVLSDYADGKNLFDVIEDIKREYGVHSTYHQRRLLRGKQMDNELTVPVMPYRLTADDLRAVGRDPMCAMDDKDELYTRLGWLISAYDAIVAERLKTLNAVPPAPTFERKENGQ